MPCYVCSAAAPEHITIRPSLPAYWGNRFFIWRTTFLLLTKPEEIMRKKQAARHRFTAAFALAALVLAFAVSDVRATETLVDADPDFLVLNPEGEQDTASEVLTQRTRDLPERVIPGSLAIDPRRRSSPRKRPCVCRATFHSRKCRPIINGMAQRAADVRFSTKQRRESRHGGRSSLGQYQTLRANSHFPLIERFTAILT